MTIPYSPIVPPSRYTILGLCILMLLLSACTEEVETKLLLNGQTFASHPLQPKASDTEGYLKLINTPGVAVIVVDRSEPSEEVSARKWTVTGPDGRVARTAEDVPNLELSFDRPGWYSVGLEVNGQEEDAVTNWLLVEGSQVPEDFTDNEDGFWLISPASDGMETEDRDYELRMHTNLYDEGELENISVTLNEREVKGLVFDGEELVTTADVKLRKGENRIDVLAEIDGKEYSESVTINRNTVSIGSIGEFKPDPEPSPEPTPLPTVLPWQGAQRVTNYATRARISNCPSIKDGSVSITITAQRAVELNSFTVHTDACGRMDILVTDSQGNEVGSKSGLTLIQGPNEIFLNSIPLSKMKSRDKWTVTMNMRNAVDNKCEQLPQLLDLASCAAQSTGEQYLRLAGRGKKTIEKIDYTY